MNNRKNYFGYHCPSNVTWSDALTPSVGIHCGQFNSWVLGFGKFWRPLAKSTEFCQSVSQTVQSDEQTAKSISVIIVLAISRRATQSLLVYMLGTWPFDVRPRRLLILDWPCYTTQNLRSLTWVRTILCCPRVVKIWHAVVWSGTTVSLHSRSTSVFRWLLCQQFTPGNTVARSVDVG